MGTKREKKRLPAPSDTKGWNITMGPKGAGYETLSLHQSPQVKHKKKKKGAETKNKNVVWVQLRKRRRNKVSYEK